MNNFKQQIIVFFIGIFTILFLLEVGLRITGFLYSKDIPSASSGLVPEKENHYVILCLGNSWTLGAGAPKGQSYPDDLQRKLDKKFNGRVMVINKGWWNENSSELLFKLEATLNKIKPNMVILQTGQPNWWNFYRYNDYLKRENLDSRNLAFSINDFISNIRVYRLACLLYDNIRSKKVVKIISTIPNQEKELLKKYIEEIRSGKKEIFLDKQKSEEALNFFKKMINFDPDYPKNYFNIGEIYFFQENYDEALKWFMKAVEVAPNFRDGQENKSYCFIRRIRKIYKGEQDEMINKKIDTFIEKFKKTNPDDSYNFMLLKSFEINRWMESDVREIIRVIQDKNIKIILQNYPFKLESVNGLINSTLRNIARDLNISFVDNAVIFQKMFNSGVNREDFYSSDGHCNARGYEVIAENVYNVVMEQLSDLDRGKN